MIKTINIPIDFINKINLLIKEKVVFSVSEYFRKSINEKINRECRKYFGIEKKESNETDENKIHIRMNSNIPIQFSSYCGISLYKKNKTQSISVSKKQNEIIDLLVQKGYFLNKSDFVRIAIEENIEIDLKNLLMSDKFIENLKNGITVINTEIKTYNLVKKV